jgi:hypothetical protein
VNQEGRTENQHQNIFDAPLGTLMRPTLANGCHHATGNRPKEVFKFFISFLILIENINFIFGGTTIR